MNKIHAFNSGCWSWGAHALAVTNLCIWLFMPSLHPKQCPDVMKGTVQIKWPSGWTEQWERLRKTVVNVCVLKDKLLKTQWNHSCAFAPTFQWGTPFHFCAVCVLCFQVPLSSGALCLLPFLPVLPRFTCCDSTEAEWAGPDHSKEMLQKHLHRKCYKIVLGACHCFQR